MTETVVIVGAGHAGGHAASALRAQGYEGKIIILGEEPHVPYERPPLSKQFLAGALEQERTYLKSAAYYADKNIDLHTGTRAGAIDREAKNVTLDGGGSVAYDKLILATGSRVRKLPIPGADLGGIHYLRTIEDTLGIRAGLKPGAKLVIVGGGYIGLEVAAVALKSGANVTVLEMEERVMKRVVAREISGFYQAMHKAEGVDIRLQTGVTAFEGDGRVAQVITGGGGNAGALEADLVVVGVGIMPATELAEAAGLAVDNGVVVDEFCRTGDESIYAVGDVTNHPNGLLGKRLRLESVQNALSQATTAAAAICGNPRAYNEIPWFWSDQYDLNLQIVGLSEPGDEVVLRGDPATRVFSVAYLRGGVLVALNAVNNRRDFIQAKRLIANVVSPDRARLADPDVAIKEL